ncbi:MAG: hypothetical protein AW11_02951 [Candidatus Accumulibacter regalis]|uniref:Uncharacterized protein n=1 Tax=Accumulibacter regalis TaxID=522306 RepID=A0A011PG00_ACCRE|nr:MAG: hypothetical protein AW11_02951 [Candidatus Accumulibacter regalis]
MADLALVVEIDGREGQHDRAQRCHGTLASRWVEQCQLASRVAQAGDDLFLGLGEARLIVVVEARLIVVVTALLFLLQHCDRHGHDGQREQQEGTAKEDAQPERRQPGQRFHSGDRTEGT